MSHLIAIAYPSETVAQQAVATLGRLQKQQLIELDDVMVARRDGDKIKLDQGVGLTGAGALGGAAWGGLIGLLFLAPIAGMAIGAATGAIAGHFSDYGIDDKFAKGVASSLPAGGAAVFLLVRRSTPDRVLEEMKPFGGTVLQTNLSAEAEQRLKDALAGQSSAAESPAPSA
ncbi:MAG TPA: DUF1269 domain-containing protein [Thermomicrobiales bacterium]